MEVAGLVLGGIPLAIHALQEYRSFLISLRNARRGLDSIIRRLRTQQRILENTCETLLQGIVPPSAIGTMIQQPFDPQWTQHEEHIKLRLDQDWDVFQDTAREMKTVVNDLQAKLSLDDKGNSTLKDRASFLTTLKEGVRFTLRCKDYKDLIAALNEGNSTLRTLALQSKELEPLRQSRIQTGFIRRVQQLTKGIYTSLCASINCKCASAHGIGLQLASQKGGLINMVYERHVNKPTFGIAFGTNRAKSTERWDQFHASLASDKSDRPSVPLMPQVSSSRAGSGGSRQAPARVAVPTTPNSPFTSTTSTMIFPKTSTTHGHGDQTVAHHNLTQIENLCRRFVEEQTSLNGGCFGFVTDETNQFYLSHKSCNPTGSTLFTLRDLLSGNHSQLPGLDYNQKARIAYTLSSNLPSLITTPWLEKVINLDGIAFFRVKDGPNGWVYHLDQVYLPKDLAIPPSTANLSCGHSTHLPSDKYKPLMILSLGCLLVQIILGHNMEDFNVAERSCLCCLMTQQAAACRKLGAVLAKGGDMYADAVNWCLQNYLSAANLDDEEFNHRYYSTVVAKLEALVDIVTSFSAS